MAVISARPGVSRQQCPEPGLLPDRIPELWLQPCRLFANEPVPPGGCQDVELPITYR